MRIIQGTNVLVSALLSSASPPARVLGHWRQGHFTLLCCDEQLDELRRVTRYPKIRERLPASLAGRLVNDLRSLTVMVGALPDVDVSPDPWDNYLLAMAEAGNADFLVTGDKADLLGLSQHGSTKIITVRQFLEKL